jgi:PPK2 family polyphosphate:nucleotide phosphotransferase
MAESGRWRVAPGARISLARIDPGSSDGAPGPKKHTRSISEELRAELDDLQGRLYAEGARALLVVLQALDAGGKDGTIRSVFAGVNPQGVRVMAFKPPTPVEQDLDFLWRVHPHVPRAGEIAIFNRSHYEDVLVPRVHRLVPKAVWTRRYDHINAFEALLHDAGTRVVKVFLHVSREEQRQRLQERIEVPRKRWKFDPGDLAERERWTDYQHAYRDILQRTSTADAPWYVIPADHKWYRDWAVLRVLTETLREMNPQYPPPPEEVAGIVVPS